MKYVALIYQGSTPLPGTPEWSTLSEEEQQAIYADYNSLNSTPGVTPGMPLGLPEDATTVRSADGKPVVTDGPFVGIKEAIGGWFVVEADDLDAAIEVAARIPIASLHGADRPDRRQLEMEETPRSISGPATSAAKVIIG